MANKLILGRLNGIQKALVALFESSAKLGSSNSTVTGTEREIFILHFLREILPPQYRIGTGVVTDADEKTSGQLDIVIELPFTPSFSFVASTPRVYLADTIGAVIEVKSDLRGYLTGTKDGNAEKKFITGGTKMGSKYAPLAAIQRNVVVVEVGQEDKPGPLMQLKLSHTIPTYVVGYKGYERADALKKHLDKLNRTGEKDERHVVRGILQFKPSIFVGSNEEIYEDSKAIGAFINSLHWELHRTSPLSWPDLRSYFGLQPRKSRVKK